MQKQALTLRVVIDARLRDGEPGGVQQVVIGLACGLSRLPDAGDEYLFVTWRGQSAWLVPFVRGACRIVEIRPGGLRAVGRGIRNAAGRAGLLGVLPASAPGIKARDGAIERLRPDVIHFPTQRAFLTDTPSIYQPHDLQHLHLPEFFPAPVRDGRDAAYRAYCRQAGAVVVLSEWCRDDVVKQYGLDPSKIVVIPGAPLLPELPPPDDATTREASQRLALPERFAYFPAHTYPHKNHLGLLHALRQLRDGHHLVVPLVCSGRQNEFYRVIRREIDALGLSDQVRFLGFVSPADVHVLYRTCRAVVFPTLFEGFGLPLCEALAAGAPIACSRVTCLPEQADGAAVLFDPRDEEDLARAIREVWCNESLRAQLVQRGHDVTRRMSWDRAAADFQALYRHVAAGGSGRKAEDGRMKAKG